MLIYDRTMYLSNWYSPNEKAVVCRNFFGNFSAVNYWFGALIKRNVLNKFENYIWKKIFYTFFIKMFFYVFNMKLRNTY